MVHHKRLQVIVSSFCLVCALVLYWFFSFQQPRQFLSIKTQPYAGQKEFSTVLHEKDHIFRQPHKISLHLNITAKFRRPDGVKKRVYLINGQFPAPTIECRSGDEFEIEVENSLDNDEGLVLHWHGLFMRNANRMDGVVGLTQPAILPKEKFTYRFKIDSTQAGSFWYHAHSAVQRADGFYGSFIVHRPAFSQKSEREVYQYDDDRVLLIGDWYHRPAQQVLDYYMDWRNFGNEPAPDSLLINGKGVFDCSMAVPARPVDCKSVISPHLELVAPRTRVRVVNTGVLTGFNLSTSGYRMKVIQLDGGNRVDEVGPSNSIGILYPGERVDILIERLKEHVKTDSTMTIQLDRENMKLPNLALKPVQSFLIKDSSSNDRDLRGERQKLTNSIDLTNMQGSDFVTEQSPVSPNKTFVLYTKVEILSRFRNIPKGFTNRTSWPVDDLKTSRPLIEFPRHEREQKAFLPYIEAADDMWVDVVLNNMDEKGHPFHLHGYDFYVLSTYASPTGRHGQFNPFDREEDAPGGPMNLRNPPKKDTVFVPRMGYVVLRFRANNKGLWYFHCHVLWHEAVGMSLAFDIDEK